MAVLNPATFGYQPVIEPSSSSDERFVLLGRYETSVALEEGTRSVQVELLVDPDSESFWASIAEVGVAASGNTPADAAVAAIRAAALLL